mmetsp:Transcript_9248/g.10532  ORF Transcript_9248/g.10532 Transcript_9248/m.10532 type:complete len:115 (-) Transcript_9248:283-627(-)
MVPTNNIIVRFDDGSCLMTKDDMNMDTDTDMDHSKADRSFVQSFVRKRERERDWMGTNYQQDRERVGRNRSCWDNLDRNNCFSNSSNNSSNNNSSSSNKCWTCLSVCCEKLEGI